MYHFQTCLQPQKNIDLDNSPNLFFSFLTLANVIWLIGSCLFQSRTGALEGPEVDGFVKDMMELVQVIHGAQTWHSLGVGAAIVTDSTVDFWESVGLTINARDQT